MNTQTPPPENRARRLHPVFKVMLGGAALLFLLLAALLGLALKEYRRKIPPPGLANETPSFLELNESAAKPEARDGSHRPAMDEMKRGVKLVAKSTPVNATSSSLKFKPCIPDTADVSPVLRARAAEINLLFDHVFRMVEEYERMKEALQYQDAMKMIHEIETQYRAARKEILEATGERPERIIEALNELGNRQLSVQERKLYGNADETRRLIQERDEEMTRWILGEQVDAHARIKRWYAASVLAWSRLTLLKWQWIIRQMEQGNGQPTLITDYNRATNGRDYDRVVYYFQQTGGLRGFTGVMNLYIERKEEAFFDSWRALKKTLTKKP